MNTIINLFTVQNVACACVGALVYAIVSALISRLDRQIRRQLRKWEKASPEYRNRQAMLRQQGRDKLSAIMVETDDPWSAPVQREARR